MDNRFRPLEVNPRTQEPFLRLRKHPNVIITPPRESDAPHLLPPLNDERVHVWLNSPPFPYTYEHAQTWINKIKLDCDQGLKELVDALENEKSPTLTHSPVRFLREVQEDGSDVFLGDVGFSRCSDILLEDAKYDNDANLELPAGDGDIVWTIGDFLIPSHHRRGIMTDAVDTLINELGKPLLGARHIVAMAYVDNEGSKKVFLRNGFNLVRCIVNYAVVKGFQRDLVVFERYD